MKPRFFKPVQALILLLLVSSYAPAALASPTFDTGVDAFYAKRYHAAEDMFNLEIQNNPSNQAAHLYLGRTLINLLDAKAARTEFETCFRLSPFTPEGRMARAEVQRLQGGEQAKARGPADSPDITAHSSALIQAEANADAYRYRVQGERGARWAEYIGGIQADRIRRQAQAEMGYTNDYWRNRYGDYDAYRNYAAAAGGYGGINGGGYGAGGGYGGGYGGGWGGGYNNGRQREISNWANIRANYAVTDSRVQSNNYRMAAAKAALELNKSADNLLGLLGERYEPGKAHLRALGTDLYVRNYSVTDDGPRLPPEDPPVQMRATAQRLVDQPQGLRAVPLSLDQGSKR